MTKKITAVFSFVLLFAILFAQLPLNFAAAGSSNPPPVLTSASYILADADSGQILYGKDETTRMFPASTTKLMTAILAAEYAEQHPEATVTVTKQTLEDIPTAASKIDLKADETLPLSDLMYALLLSSGNDAAATIAQLIDGDAWKTTFPEKMNQKAAEIGASDTHFTNPHGLHDDEHYSTAKDLCTILAYALKNKTVQEILKTETYTIGETNKSDARDLKTTNELIIPTDTNYDPNVIGGKTGFTEEAGYCFAGAARKGGNVLIAVVLKNDDDQKRFEETAKLLSYGFNNFTKTEIPSDSIPRKKVGLVAEDKRMGEASVYAGSSAYLWLHNGLTLADNVRIETNTPENFIYEENGVYTAQATVSLSEPSRYMKSELGTIPLTVTTALYDTPKPFTGENEGNEPENNAASSGPNALTIVIIVIIVIMILALCIMIGCYIYANVKRKNAVKNRKFSRMGMGDRSLNPDDRNRNNEIQIDEFDEFEQTIVRTGDIAQPNDALETKYIAAETELRKIEKERIDKKINALREKGIIPENIQELVLDQENVNDDLNDTRILSEDINEALKKRKEQRKNQKNDF